MSTKEVDIGEISRYLGGFAVLISALVYIGVVSATDIVYTYGFEYIAKFLYYLGFLGLIIAILSYIVKEEKTAKICFGGSIFITALSLFLVDTGALAYDVTMYYGAVVLYLVLGLILIYLFMSEEKLEETIKYGMEFLVGVLYLIALILWVNASGADLTTTNLLSYNYFIPQTLLLGGVFGFFFAILLIIDSIIKLAWKEAPEAIVKVIKMLLVFSWLLGYLYEALVRPISTFGGGAILASGIANIFATFYLITQPTSIFFAILVILFIYHVITEYAI